MRRGSARRIRFATDSPSPWKQTGIPLNQRKVIKYQPPDKGPSTLSTAQNKNIL
ncbi:hypothetical protein [Butyricimonas faecihominis]|uniref:hypothetical protein n=1 Tax=Butyricimonas faecihominis TaxID=1472416 RepID=UPI0032C0201D